MIRKLRGGFVALAFFGVAVVAEASLVGDTVDCDGQPSRLWSCIPTSATVVEPGVEFELLGDGFGGGGPPPSFDIDIGASSILVTYTTPNSSFGPDNGDLFTLSDLDWVDAPGIITGVQLQTFGVTDLEVSDISFGNDFVTVDFNFTGWRTADSALITLETTHALVPEPTILALVGLGLVGAGAIRRRKQAA